MCKRVGGVHKVLTWIADTLNSWFQLSHQRKHPAHLDERMLCDIGVTYGDVWAEMRRISFMIRPKLSLIGCAYTPAWALTSRLS